MLNNNNDIILQTSLLPFKNVFNTKVLKKGDSIKNIVESMVPFNFSDARLVITLNGIVIDYESYKDYEIKEGDLISLNFIPEGGGSGKNILGTVALIAAAVALPYVAGQVGLVLGNAVYGAGLGGLGAGGFTGLAAGAYALGYGGTLLAGSLLLTVASRALMSTPVQSGSSTESKTQSISAGNNAINKYGVVPICLGVNRMFPPQAALPYTESFDGKQYLRQLFTYGYGNVVVSERKLGETLISEYSDIEMNDKLNGDLNEGTDLYSNDVFQETMNFKITKEAGYVIRTTQKDTDECVIDISFSGLCYIDDNGNQQNTTVKFEIQFAETGTENWSTSSEGFTIAENQSFVVDLTGAYKPWKNFVRYGFQRNFFFGLDVDSGIITKYIKEEVLKNETDTGVVFPSLPENYIILGYVNGRTGDYVDNRSNFVGKYISSINDFVCEKEGNNLTFSGGKILGYNSTLSVTDSTSQVLTKSKRLIFPNRAQYDIRIKRLTDDSQDNMLVNASYLTSIKSITYRNPVNFANISGTAIRIKATDQLNGTISSYNCIVSSLIKSYNTTTKEWEDGVISSNPADIFRYVLQSPAFAKKFSDSEIDIEKLEEWAIYCEETGLSYNKIIDYDTSFKDVLNDICAAGVATIDTSNNIYSVIIDNERPVVKGLVTPRNCWDYSGNINYPEIPHALRIEFRNQAIGYETDERIVYADGYNENNSTLFERLQFDSCTNADLAYWYGRRYFATALLQPETHTFKMDFECMTFNRGDRISLVNDVILVGVGQGRIVENILDENNNVMGFKIDDFISVPIDVNNLGVRIRDNDGKNINYYLLQKPTNTDATNTLYYANSIAYDDAPVVNSLCAFVEDGKELDLIVTQIEADQDLNFTVTATNYAPERFNPLGTIPPFNSNITIPVDFYKPFAPELSGEIQTDESVMIKNSDGSLLSVMIIPLLNRNDNTVTPVVKIKKAGASEWYTPSSLKKENNQIILTGLQDGASYDVEIRYQRQTGLQLLSDALTLKNIKFIGGSNPPKKVENFRVTVINGMGLFEWNPNDDVDISHYVIRYSATNDDVTWDNAQIVMDKITSSSITNVIHKGTYLIKAVDMLGYISEEPSVIISNETGAFDNVVEELIQEPNWLGTKENLVVSEKNLEIDTGYSTGYYYFNPEIVDLGEVYECSLTANIRTDVRKRDRIRDVSNVRSLSAVRDIGKDINADGSWVVELQMSMSDDLTTWSDWFVFTASKQQFRACKFRLKLYTNSEHITPYVTTAHISIDMPDRYESGEDVEITDENSGAVVTYKNTFRNNPAVNITLQNAAVDDKIEFVEKNNKGFTIKVFNATLNTYVKRTFDFLAAGYGKTL